jgi:hypothetical protein
MPRHLASCSERITGACWATQRARKPFPGVASERFLLWLGALVLPVVAGCSYLKSDEQLLRDEFKIPRTVVLDSISVFPQEAGWFGREGLTIDAAFRFSRSQFETYRQRAERDGRWKPMPPSREFLMKMLGIRSHVEAVARSYALLGKPAPPLGSVYNRTEDQLYDELTGRLPLDVQHGLYQCRTAGNDIMHALKVPCTALKGDLNDYMFAVLDLDGRVLRIRVHANY